MLKFLLMISLGCIVLAYAPSPHTYQINPSKRNYYDTSRDSYPEVKVTNWNNLVLMVSGEVWVNGRDEIVSQIGESEFEAVKGNFSHRTIHPAFSASSPDNFKNPEFFKKLNNLRLYKVASFIQHANGKDWGRMGIVKAPYKGNESWDTSVVWDSVYFILPDSVIKLIQ